MGQAKHRHIPAAVLDEQIAHAHKVKNETVSHADRYYALGVERALRWVRDGGEGKKPISPEMLALGEMAHG